MPSLQLSSEFKDLNLDNSTIQKKKTLIIVNNNINNNNNNNNNNETNRLDLQLLVIII